MSLSKPARVKDLLMATFTLSHTHSFHKDTQTHAHFTKTHTLTKKERKLEWLVTIIPKEERLKPLNVEE